MRRRDFIAGLGGAAAWPLAARAQQPVLPVIGLLDGASLEERREDVAAFHQGLAETGYVEGRNVAIEYRWGEGHNDRMPALVSDLARRQVAVIVTTGGTMAVLAAKAATQTIPIVFFIAGDPVEMGLVASFNRPGGNLTGVSNLNSELVAKRLELLHELVPSTASIGLLVNPSNVITAKSETMQAQIAARVLGVRLVIVNASTLGEIEVAFATLVQQGAGALLLATDLLWLTARDQLVAQAARRRVPTIYPFRSATAAGGLMTYGPSIADTFRQLGIYAGRVLKGEKLADLPVMQPTKFELVINLKTAKTLGLNVPETLKATANELIE